jgi:hypothetical protein
MEASAQLTRAETSAWRQVVLPIFFEGTDGTIEGIGTCWIFAVNGTDALAFSATHVFDYLVRREGRHERSVASSMFAKRTESTVLQTTRIKSLYEVRNRTVLPVDILKIYKDDAFDVAVCHLRLQDAKDSKYNFGNKIDIYSGPIREGTKVKFCGYTELALTKSEIVPSRGHATFKVVPKIEFLSGTVDARFGSGRPGGQPGGPCFEVYRDSVHGMSGGPVFIDVPGEAPVACGLISRGNFFSGGTTVCSELWPAFSLLLSDVRVDQATEAASLLDLVDKKVVVDKADGRQHFRHEIAENGSHRISWL